MTQPWIDFSDNSDEDVLAKRDAVEKMLRSAIGSKVTDGRIDKTHPIYLAFHEGYEQILDEIKRRGL